MTADRHNEIPVLLGRGFSNQVAFAVCSHRLVVQVGRADPQDPVVDDQELAVHHHGGFFSAARDRVDEADAIGYASLAETSYEGALLFCMAWDSSHEECSLGATIESTKRRDATYCVGRLRAILVALVNWFSMYTKLVADRIAAINERSTFPDRRAWCRETTSVLAILTGKVLGFDRHIRRPAIALRRAPFIGRLAGRAPAFLHEFEQLHCGILVDRHWTS